MFIETKIILVLNEDLKLGLDKPEEGQVPFKFRKDAVMAYWKDSDTLTKVILDSGFECIVCMSYEELDRIVNKPMYGSLNN